MTAVAERQASLDGIPDVQAPARPVPELRAGIIGHLLQHAAARDHVNGQVFVEVLLEQHVEHHPRALPVFAAFPYPDQGCVDATLSGARRKALQMPAGTEVMLVGRGLEIGRYSGRDVLRVLHVDALDITSNH